MQAEFLGGTMAEKCMWQTVVLIPKGKRESRGIGLVEVLWKAVSSLMNRQLTSATTFHDVLYRFWAGRGTGTAALNTKLLQQRMSTREAVLFEVLMDLQKAYDALDWETCLDIITAYGVGTRTIQLLRTYWDQLIMVDRAGGYFGRPFKGH